MSKFARSASASVIVVLAFVFFVAAPASGQSGNPNVPVRISRISTQPIQVAEPPTNSADYENAPVSELIDLLEQLSGKHYIRDANLNGIPPVSVNGNGLSKEESIKLITATLLLNGVAIIPVDDRTMKVVTVGTNKNPRSEGLRLYTNPDDLPADDQIVSYYMMLDHINPLEAAGIFVQVAPVHSYGSYVPAPSANGIILTENVSIVRELIDLKKQVDIRRDVLPPSPPPHGPGPRHHPILFLIFLIVIFMAGYFFARFRYRKRSV